MIEFQKLAEAGTANVANIANVFRPVIYDNKKTSFPARENIGLKNVRNVSNVSTPPPFPADWENRFTDEQLERLAVRTIDGGLSDDEALQAEGLG